MVHKNSALVNQIIPLSFMEGTSKSPRKECQLNLASQAGKEFDSRSAEKIK